MARRRGQLASRALRTESVAAKFNLKISPSTAVVRRLPLAQSYRGWSCGAPSFAAGRHWVEIRFARSAEAMDFPTRSELSNPSLLGVERESVREVASQFW